MEMGKKKGLSDLRLKGNCISVLLVVTRMDFTCLFCGVKRVQKERFI
jgi:hypothetical protein